MPTETNAALLAASEKVFVVAPAGFGKTELIARAIELSPKKSLILTHTHSGVNAMRARLQRFGVSRNKVEVATIAGWALKYASAYPTLSGLGLTLPAGNEWNDVYNAAVELLGRRVARNTIQRSFSGVYVDEYQDCNLVQHSIVMAVADVLPCRLLGDPLQAIFDFAGPTISWADDVVPNFERLPDLSTPYRWLDSNPQLGEWLLEVRPLLIAGQSVELSCAPLQWLDNTPQNQRLACLQAAKDKGLSVVAVRKWPNDCHAFASKLSGLYGSMEELDCRGLMDFARRVDDASRGSEMVIHLIEFATQCFTTIGTELSKFVDRYAQDTVPSTDRLTRNRAVIEALNRLAESGDLRDLVSASRLIERYPDAKLYRRELWQEMKTTVLTYLGGAHDSVYEAAWYVRDRSRRTGRRPEQHIVSRTLLIKGLEFDHAIVVDADKFNAKEFYVALTRGKHGLTVLSSKSSVEFDQIPNVLPAFGG